VVITSSTTTTVERANRRLMGAEAAAHRVSANASRTLAWRSEADSVTCAGPRRLRRSTRHTGTPIARAKSSA
jgi:hypothetical protein